MATQQNNGMRWVLIQQPNGQLQSTNCQCDNNANLVRANGNPANFRAPQNAQDAARLGYAVLSPQAFKQAVQSSLANPGLANQYGLVDVPGQGATGVSRTEKPGGFGASGVTYTIVYKNDNGGAVLDRGLIGDWPGTYAISQGLVPVAGSTMTISGSAGTLSQSHLTARMLARPIRVSSMQIRATTNDFFTGNNVFYFDTTTNPQSGTVTHVLPLSALVTPEQYNSTIQIYPVPELLDGTNGLRFNLAIGMVITVTLTIVSEGKAHSMVLFD